MLCKRCFLCEIFCTFAAGVFFNFFFFQVLSLLLLPDGLTKNGFLYSASSHIQRGKYDIYFLYLCSVDWTKWPNINMSQAYQNQLHIFASVWLQPWHKPLIWEEGAGSSSCLYRCWWEHLGQGSLTIIVSYSTLKGLPSLGTSSCLYGCWSARRNERFIFYINLLFYILR